MDIPPYPDPVPALARLRHEAGCAGCFLAAPVGSLCLFALRVSPQADRRPEHRTSIRPRLLPHPDRSSDPAGPVAFLRLGLSGRPARLSALASRSVQDRLAPRWRSACDHGCSRCRRSSRTSRSHGSPESSPFVWKERGQTARSERSLRQPSCSIPRSPSARLSGGATDPKGPVRCANEDS